MGKINNKEVKRYSDPPAVCSYPGSGNSFVMYLLEVIFQRRAATQTHDTSSYIADVTRNHFPHRLQSNNELDSSIDGFNFNICGNVDVTLNMLVTKYHSIEQGWNKPIVFILRDFREGLIGKLARKTRIHPPNNSPAMAGTLEKKIPNYKNIDIKLISKEINGYMNMLQAFDNYKENKILIHYENLMSDNDIFRKEIISVARFIIDNHPDVLSLDDAMKNIDSIIRDMPDHRRNSRLLYTPGCQSSNFEDRDTLKFHQSHINNPELIKQMELYCRWWDDCGLFEKYLNRYVDLDNT